ncbi:DUF427 domain-containing protein [Fulvivirga sp.]|uniref:DUF427 domain-containing protein n=1 Tax=Fulvivirga sp. TaxID=1931237 RepID=UPI0032ED922C
MKAKPIKPKIGQESVWDYPRPPKLEPVNKHIQIYFGGELIADTKAAYRVLETSHPPVYYIPLKDIKTEYLKPSSQHSFCEWKGKGNYYHLQVGDKKELDAAWYYPKPSKAFAAIKDYPAFYAHQMDKCLVDGEEVTPQPGNFYGGWITKDIVGPFKGVDGSWGW